MNLKRIKKIAKRRINFFINPISNYFKIKDVNLRTKYSRLYKKLSINDDFVLYESRDGKSMTGNPYAIFKHLLKCEKGKHLIHIWSISDKKYLELLEKRYEKHKNVRFVLKNSKGYLEYLATSKYLFNNSTFQNMFTIKRGQIYTNTWHGTPLKYMGNDIKGQPMGSSNVIRNFLSTDFILSPNNFTSNIFKRSFKLDGLYNGTILEEGYPRIDLTVNASKIEVENALRDESIDIDERKIILYAPTWKGDRVSKPRNDIDQIHNDISMLEERFGDEYRVLVKVHPFLYSIAESSELLKENLISDTFDPNEILSITDILVTDYSSIFFDFLVTKRPILFYMWDYDDYNSNRGMYIDTNQLPGPIAKDIESLMRNIDEIKLVEKNYSDKYNSFVKKYCYHEYGNVTNKVVNRIFNFKDTNVQTNSVSSNIDKESSHLKRKEKILIYPGGFRNNGITGAMLSLLDNIDYKKYDVTLLINFTKSQESILNMLKVNSNVRFLFKVGRINQTIFENYRNYITKNRGVGSDLLERIFPTNMYEREYKRIFGKSNFDYIMDYSGYSMFWANILLAGNAKKKLIFMHSDLYSDMNKTINGFRPHYLNLRGVFSLYKYFDELVSVSEATMKLNKENLKEYIGDTKLSYIINSINPEKIKKLANDDSDLYYKGNKPVLVNVKNSNGNFEIIDVPIPFEGEGVFNFVNMGRLSPEKGQDQLIKAFASIHQKYNNTRLYIIGEGASRSTLEQIIASLGLVESVFLVGHKSNPFYLMNKCDAFVLSSHYEGQPLVLLESLTLGRQTIATDIIANRYVLEDGKYGILIDNSEEGLYEGMQSIIEDNLNQSSFDAEKYNKEAMENFYEKLD